MSPVRPVIALVPTGKIYSVVCAECGKQKAPFLLLPPPPGWICGWCVQVRSGSFRSIPFGRNKPARIAPPPEEPEQQQCVEPVAVEVKPFVRRKAAKTPRGNHGEPATDQDRIK